LSSIRRIGKGRKREKIRKKLYVFHSRARLLDHFLFFGPCIDWERIREKKKIKGELVSKRKGEGGT